MDRPLVSYVVPAYNVAPYIARAVQSLLNQTYSPIEIILVDDGTKDDLASAIAPFRDKITLLETPNRGVSAARNLGFAQSKGEFVCFLDGDDWVEPEHAATLVSIHTANRELVGAFCEMTYVEATLDGTIVKLHSTEHSRRDPDFLASLILSNVQLASILFRREAIAIAGGFDPSFQCGEDWDLALKVAKLGPFQLTPISLVNYLVRPNSVTANYRRIYEQGVMVVEKHMRTDSSGRLMDLRRRWLQGFRMYTANIMRQTIKRGWSDSGLRRLAIRNALKFCWDHPAFFLYAVRTYGRSKKD